MVVVVLVPDGVVTVLRVVVVPLGEVVVLVVVLVLFWPRLRPHSSTTEQTNPNSLFIAISLY